MKTQIKVHPVQARILVSLLFKKESRFRDLNNTKLTNDHFSFHIKELLRSGLIIKTKTGAYALTKLGKEFANRFDTDNKDIERQAKLGALIVCTKTDKGKRLFLIQQRLKQPYYGFYGFITGKIRWGETIFETAKRELSEETGLVGKFNLSGIKHKTDYTKSGKLLEDKFFFVFKVEKTKGKLIEKFEGGRNQWLPKKEILKLPNLFNDIAMSLKMIDNSSIEFSEAKYKVRGY